ncbi:MAG: GNAT family N-acetyltransferase [Alkalinema sp. RU_4_3]|nr:GNAT family N-acetyltransferase [Alkalinema sp. RU_4_3]
MRPAQRRDCQAIRRLTQQLLPDRWRGYKTLLGLGLLFFMALLAGLGWAYPGLFWPWLMAMVPLLVLLIVGLVAAALDDGLHWERYWVLDRRGVIVGCGRVEDYDLHGELYDLVIDRSLRRQGLGQFLVEQLVKKCRRPLYLASLPGAIAFYQQLGFVMVDESELMPWVQSRLSLTNPRFRQLGLQPMVLR